MVGAARVEYLVERVEVVTGGRVTRYDLAWDVRLALEVQESRRSHDALGVCLNFRLTKQQHLEFSSHLLLIHPQEFINCSASGEGDISFALPPPETQIIQDG